MPERDDVIAEVERRAQTTADPALSDEEVEAIVDAQFTAVWAAETEYGFDTRIRPTTRNGHRYKVITAGTSGAIEPSWLTGDYSRTSDGTVLWEEAGADARSAYDVDRAVYEAWMLKAAKASEYFGKDEQGIYQRCVDMASRYAPVGIA